jgi:predicted nucleic acid-binding protein
VGSLMLPIPGPIYADAQILIYTVEAHPVYGPPLAPLWTAVLAGSHDVVSSELAMMEVLVGPLKKGDANGVADFEQFFGMPGVRFEPITHTILRRAAELRAITRLRTPDAIHAVTALVIKCPMFLTNDRDFQKVPGLPVTILDDLRTP